MNEEINSWRVLVVDDDPEMRETTRLRLEKLGYSVEEARDGEEALLKVKDFDPHLILLDLLMPGMDGMEFCRSFKEEIPGKFIPIIVISARGEAEQKIQALELGASDYLTKPFSLRELEARIKVAIRLKELQDKLKSLTITDELTQVYNRRYLEEKLNNELKRATRYNYHLSGILVDVDNFKQANDRFGHDFGDLVLKRVAQVIKNAVRTYDTVFRLGGDEFFILLPHTNTTQAEAVVQRIKERMNSARLATEKGEFPLSTSMGIVTYPDSRIQGIEDFLKIADEGMYQDKAKKK